ncbi:hypothetical protein OAS86_01150 [Gammaproteobacteria bacterium]|nr:hypothetical protein [Gammaproteobacteria bacterium]
MINDDVNLVRVCHVAIATDELWECDQSNELLARIYDGKTTHAYLRVYAQTPEGEWDVEDQERIELRKQFVEKTGTC